MNEIVVAQVYAPIPAKKNNRVVLANGVNIPSKEYRSWHKAHLQQFKDIQKKHGTFTCPVCITLGVSFGDNRRRDLDNALTSVLDLIKDSKLIGDDDWARVPKVVAEVVDVQLHYALVTIAPLLKPWWKTKWARLGLL